MTYQHGLGVGLECNDATRNTFLEVARGGWLQAHVLFIDGEPCAFQHGVAYGRKYFIEQMGFDPKWKDHNVGSVLFLHVLEGLCGGNGDGCTIDFGFGDANYKRSYGTQCWNEASFYVFAPRWRPILVNLLTSSATCLSNGLARLLQKTGLIGRLKRRWRESLQKQAEKQECGDGG
jgi:hypothetical protein